MSLTLLHACLRNNNLYLNVSSNQSAPNISISLKIQNQMEKIITIIKGMGNSFSGEEVKQLNRLLYRATDNLTELELSLRQLQVRRFKYNNIICMACGKPWPHNEEPLIVFPSSCDQAEKLLSHTVSNRKQE